MKQPDTEVDKKKFRVIQDGERQALKLWVKQATTINWKKKIV